MVAVCGIISNEKITKEYNIRSMIINAPEIARTAKPGQFVHVKCGELTLRRPISIAGVRDGLVTICYDVRGEGTHWLSCLKPGDEVDILGPLGHGFDVSDTSKRVLLAGGGIGIYPLYSVAQLYKANAVAVLGFRSKGLVNFEKEFAECGSEVNIATDDGSYGAKGFTADIVKEILDNNKIDMVMTCGPKIMMKGVAIEASKRNIRCQVSMEERMACGIGACLACVCKIKDAEKETFTNKRICIDGPVFEGSEVEWEC